MKSPFKKEGLRLAILTLITVLTWAGFDIYMSLTADQIEPDLRKQLKAINPILDKEAIRALEGKREIDLDDFRYLLSENQPVKMKEEATVASEEATEEANREEAGETN